MYGANVVLPRIASVDLFSSMMMKMLSYAGTPSMLKAACWDCANVMVVRVSAGIDSPAVMPAMAASRGSPPVTANASGYLSARSSLAVA